jgi:hypothetical protein
MDYPVHCFTEGGAFLDIHPAHRVLYHLIYSIHPLPRCRLVALPVLFQERLYDHILDRLEAEIDKNNKYDGANHLRASASSTAALPLKPRFFSGDETAGSYKKIINCREAPPCGQAASQPF